MSVYAATEAVTLFRPNCVIVDFSRKSLDAEAFLGDVLRRGGSLPGIIALVSNRMDCDVVEMMRLGVRDILERSELTSDRLLEAISAMVFDGDLQRRLSFRRKSANPRRQNDWKTPTASRNS